MRLKPGDVVVSTNPVWAKEEEGIERRITEVRSTGYTWEYPDVPNKDFISENSSDPFFDHFWTLKEDTDDENRKTSKSK